MQIKINIKAENENIDSPVLESVEEAIEFLESLNEEEDE